MTHAELVERAARWLTKTKRCPVVATEITSRCPETPDAIGWYMGRSILVECKASRSDFLADARKHFRAYPKQGIGARRYYLTPPGLLSPEEIPEGWGLLEAHPTAVRVVKESHHAIGPGVTPFMERNHDGEITILISLLRRERGEYTKPTKRTGIHIDADQP